MHETTSEGDRGQFISWSVGVPAPSSYPLGFAFLHLFKAHHPLFNSKDSNYSDKMKLFERLWATASCVLNWLTLSPKVQSGYKQSPLIGKYSFEHGYVFPAATTTTTAPLAGPTFKPPGGRYGDLPGAGFQCEYPDMIGYEYCSNENDRTCWLRSTKDSTVYGISTDYEKLTPTGIHRYYKINATDHRIDADGIVDVSGKAFQLIHPDGKTGDEPIFPGPWIQACWGDVSPISSITSSSRLVALRFAIDCTRPCWEQYDGQWHKCTLAWHPSTKQYAYGWCQRSNAVSHPSKIRVRICFQGHTIRQLVVS